MATVEECIAKYASQEDLKRNLANFTAENLKAYLDKIGATPKKATVSKPDIIYLIMASAQQKKSPRGSVEPIFKASEIPKAIITSSFVPTSTYVTPIKSFKSSKTQKPFFTTPSVGQTTFFTNTILTSSSLAAPVFGSGSGEFVAISKQVSFTSPFSSNFVPTVTSSSVLTFTTSVLPVSTNVKVIESSALPSTLPSSAKEVEKSSINETLEGRDAKESIEVKERPKTPIIQAPPPPKEIEKEIIVEEPPEKLNITLETVNGKNEKTMVIIPASAEMKPIKVPEDITIALPSETVETMPPIHMELSNEVTRYRILQNILKFALECGMTETTRFKLVGIIERYLVRMSDILSKQTLDFPPIYVVLPEKCTYYQLFLDELATVPGFEVKKFSDYVEQAVSYCAELNEKSTYVRVIPKKDKDRIVFEEINIAHHPEFDRDPYGYFQVALRYLNLCPQRLQHGLLDKTALCLREMGVGYDAFASPFRRIADQYSSLFIDTDAKYGSLGSFWKTDLNKVTGDIFAFPPICESIINRCVKRITEEFPKGKVVYLLLQNWEKMKAKNMLESSKLLAFQHRFAPNTYKLKTSWNGETDKEETCWFDLSLYILTDGTRTIDTTNLIQSFL